MPKRDLNVCMIGYKFMGRAHSNAYLKVDKFFDVALRPVMHTVVGRDAAALGAFAGRWGWQNATTDWKKAVTDPSIDLVDVGTPNNQHKDMTLAALSAGKHVLCEKPLAATLSDAREMRDAARKAKKCRTFVGYSYRRVPAVALAYQLAREGRLGRIYHVRAFYLQGWASSPNIPLVWRFDKTAAGSGSHGDLGAHIIDMARFITGDEITEVTGAISETFIKERVIPSGVAGVGIALGAKAGGGKKGKVLVDDAVLFLARFKSGAVATFESTRFATGNYTEPLTESELTADSPYNTRENVGLPPGPINSPGLAAIQAAAHPAETDFIFYVTDPGTCGRLAFSSSEAEWERDVESYERAREEAGGQNPDTCEE